jgi:hypothetical protein
LTDGLIATLAGAQGLVEINKRVRPDPALQVAFGRQGCAEQSVVQDTLDAGSAENVLQMQRAVDQIYRAHAQGYRHSYTQALQLLDIDTTGRPCGPKAALATKGYFAHRPHRRGRQEGDVLATRYEELVVKRLYSGGTQLTLALHPLVEAAEATLALTLAQRQRTVLRIDSGGGSLAEVNWMLERGYQLHCKDFSTQRAERLAASVQTWITDPRKTGRQIGWVTDTAEMYVRPVRRIAVRCPRKNGQLAIGVLITTLSPQDVLTLTGQPAERANDPQAVLLAYVQFYDLRGAGVEIEIKEDKQGLGSAHRNKKRFAGQQIVSQLDVLAHNFLVWVRGWLAPVCPTIAKFGLLRWVRDVLCLNGCIRIDPVHGVDQIILNQADPLAMEVQVGLAALLARHNVAVYLGKT